MKLVLAIMLIGQVAVAAPRQCNPEKSKPCGASCIKKEFICHKAVTTAVVRVK